MKLGFIGVGNMASAMIGGILAKTVVEPLDVLGSAKTRSSREKRERELGICMTKDNREVVRKTELLFLAVKPRYYQSVIEEIREDIREEQILVTVAPGKTLEWLQEQFGKPVKLVRTMPNTPALVGEGMTAFCANSLVTDKDLETVRTLLESFGRAEEVEERLMSTVVAASGSSPAYLFMLMEAMADAAVAGGMPRAQAYEFVAQAVKGSAVLMEKTKLHPGVLKDMVCSPAGTTIEAVRILEREGLRSGIIEAIRVCEEKAR